RSITFSTKGDRAMQWVEMRMRVSISSNSPHWSHTASRRSPVILQTDRHPASAHGAQSTGQKLMVAIAVMTLEPISKLATQPDYFGANAALLNVRYAHVSVCR